MGILEKKRGHTKWGKGNESLGTFQTQELWRYWTKHNPEHLAKQISQTNILDCKTSGHWGQREREKRHPCQDSGIRTAHWPHLKTEMKKALNVYSWKVFALSSIRQLNIILWLGNIKFHKFNLPLMFPKIIKSHITTPNMKQRTKEKDTWSSP